MPTVLYCISRQSDVIEKERNSVSLCEINVKEGWRRIWLYATARVLLDIFNNVFNVELNSTTLQRTLYIFCLNECLECKDYSVSRKRQYFIFITVYNKKRNTTEIYSLKLTHTWVGWEIQNYFLTLWLRQLKYFVPVP